MHISIEGSCAREGYYTENNKQNQGYKQSLLLFPVSLVF